MSMKRIKRAVAKTGQYVHRQSGETKNQYCNIGTLFKGENDDGTPYLSLKIDSVPVGGGWDGWVNFYDIEERGAEKPKSQPRKKPEPEHYPEPEFDDDIPF